MKNIAEKYSNPKASLLKILRQKLYLLNQAVVKEKLRAERNEKLVNELQNYAWAYMDIIDLIESGKFTGLK